MININYRQMEELPSVYKKMIFHGQGTKEINLKEVLILTKSNGWMWKMNISLYGCELLGCLLLENYGVE